MNEYYSSQSGKDSSQQRFQEFVKSVRQENSAENLLTIGEFKTNIKGLQDVTVDSTDRMVGAINKNKASDEMIGTGMSIRDSTNEVAELSKEQIRELNLIANSLASGSRSIFRVMWLNYMAMNPLVNWFGPARQVKVAKIAQKKDQEMRKIHYRTMLAQESMTDDSLSMLASIRNSAMFLADAWATDAEKRERREQEQNYKNRLREKDTRTWWEKMLGMGKAPIKINESLLFSNKTNLQKLLVILGVAVFSLVARIEYTSRLISKTIKVFETIFKGVRVISRGVIPILRNIRHVLVLSARMFEAGSYIGISPRAILQNSAKFFKNIEALIRIVQTNKFSKILKMVGEFAVRGIKVIGKFLEPVGKFLVRFASLGKTFGKIIPGVNIVLALVDSVFGWFKGTDLADKAGTDRILGGIVGVVGGLLEFLTFGGLDFKKFWEDINAQAGSLWENIKNMDFGGIVADITKISLSIGTHIFEGFLNLVDSIINGVVKGFAWLMKKILGMTDEQFFEMKDLFPWVDFRSDISGMLANVVDKVKDFVSSLIGIITRVFSGINTIVKDISLNPRKILDLATGKINIEDYFSSQDEKRSNLEKMRRDRGLPIFDRSAVDYSEEKLLDELYKNNTPRTDRYMNNTPRTDRYMSQPDQNLVGIKRNLNWIHDPSSRPNIIVNNNVIPSQNPASNNQTNHPTAFVPIPTPMSNMDQDLNQVRIIG